VPYLTASAVVIHYEEALYQVYVHLPFETHRADTALEGHSIVRKPPPKSTIILLNIRLVKPTQCRVEYESALAKI